MAIPTYTTDLVNIDLCEAGGKTWAEPTAVGWTSGAGPDSNDDDAIQGSLSMSKAFNAAGVGGMLVNNGAGITLPTDGAFLGWFMWACPGSLYSDALGGIRIMVGTDLANFLSWDVGGKTTYVYGGWINFAVNTTITPDDTVGTGLGNSQYCGAAVNNFNSVFKGSPFVSDAYRYGRCEARVAGGETANYATFNGYAAVNDAIDYRWGLFQYKDGAYLQKGLFIFGYGAVTDFRDSNKSIFIQNTNKVTANFNTFEVRQTLSKVYLTSITITALGTVSKGRWITTDNADVQLTSCVFTDMNTFGFASGTIITNTTFRRCGIITQNGATFTGCTVDSASGTKAIVVSNELLITNTTFTSSGTGYALEGFSTAGDYTLTNLSFSGYAANGTSGNEAIHVLATSGIVNIYRSGGTAPSIHTAGATVNVISSVTLTLTGLITLSDIVILNAGTTTERVNIDQNVGTTYGYNYSDSGSYVDICIFKAGYIPYFIRNYLLSASAASLPISQVIDRNYLE